MTKYLVLLALALTACAPIDIDPATDVDSEEEIDLDSKEQALSWALPVSLRIAPVAAPASSQWVGTTVNWILQSFITLTPLQEANYLPRQGQDYMSLQRDLGILPNMASCTRTANQSIHQYLCAGSYVTCPGATLDVKPSAWSNDANPYPWQGWGPQNDANWYRTSFQTMNPATSYYQKAGGRSYIFCGYTRTRPYKLKQK